MKIRALYAMMSLCGLASCSTVRTIAFEQLCPAEVSLPGRVRTVAVVNNMPSVPEAKSDAATFGLLNADGKAVAETLAGMLADSKYFRQVIICDSALNGAPAEGTGYRALSRGEVQELAEQLGADVLFSIDRVFVQNEKKEIEYPGMMQPWPVASTRVTSVLNVYSPVRAKPLRTLVAADSTEWDWNLIPSDRQMLREAARIAAGKLSSSLVPHWRQTERLFYAGGCVEMRDAEVCIDEGDWQGAYDLWLALFNEREGGKAKARAALNLAVASEMLDEPERAKEWLEKAKPYIPEGSEEEAVWKFSSLRLAQRMGDYSRLKAQMERFGNNLDE